MWFKGLGLRFEVLGLAFEVLGLGFEAGAALPGSGAGFRGYGAGAPLKHVTSLRSLQTRPEVAKDMWFEF